MNKELVYKIKPAVIIKGQIMETGPRGLPGEGSKLAFAKAGNFYINDNVITIDLMGENDSIYGTINNPIRIERDSEIEFINCAVMDGYQRQFALYIVRTGDFTVQWNDNLIWLPNGENPVLPINKIQLIDFATTDSSVLYGVSSASLMDKLPTLPINYNKINNLFNK